MLEFQIDDKGMGEEVVLPRPGTVRLQARMRFDPERDDMFRIEVVRNGIVWKSFPRMGPSSEISCDIKLKVEETCWLAVRAWGKKLGEHKPPGGYVPPWRNRNRDAPASLAHSAAIYVRVEGTRDLFTQDRAKANARAWTARLDELEMKLRDENLHFLAVENDKYDPDMAYLLKSRNALQGAIQMAREYYLKFFR